MPTEPTDIFDQWASAPSTAAPSEECLEPSPLLAADATPRALKRAVQELLKQGLLEQASKPQLFKQVVLESARVDRLLEPLDLRVKIDDVRGLAFVAVTADFQPDSEEDDDWSHPLMRRQRLTLEQSLLLAILRREFLQREQEGGLGVPVSTTVDALLPQLEIYLGATGSDMQERKRLMSLLDNLRNHGVVSEVDANERLTIRAMIVHLANPENLQALLQRLREVSAPAPQSAA